MPSRRQSQIGVLPVFPTILIFNSSLVCSAVIFRNPSAYEAGFVSTAHGKAEVEKTVSAAKKVFAEIGAA
jgi:glutamate-1-semialdehyde aminotransferase